MDKVQYKLTQPGKQYDDSLASSHCPFNMGISLALPDTLGALLPMKVEVGIQNTVQPGLLIREICLLCTESVHLSNVPKLPVH